jgi:hypothetical protein
MGEIRDDDDLEHETSSLRYFELERTLSPVGIYGEDTPGHAVSAGRQCWKRGHELGPAGPPDGSGYEATVRDALDSYSGEPRLDWLREREQDFDRCGNPAAGGWA